MRLFYVAAYGPLTAAGVQGFYVVARDEDDARALVSPHLTAGYVIERVHEQIEPPAAILRSQPVLHSSLLFGTWWDAHHGVGAQAAVQPETTEGAEQARLF